MNKNSIWLTVFTGMFFLFFGCCSTSAYAAMPSLDFTVSMSENVTVNTGGGTPTIAIDVGGVARTASYSAGSGTSALTFTYTPTAGDLDLDGITLTSPISLNGGTIKDFAGNDLNPLTFTLPNTSGVKVSYPSLYMDFVYDSDGRYTLNGTAYNDLTSFLSAAGGTFLRGSIGTYFDSAGTLQTAASGVPRFDYDPVTHAAKGFLVEDQKLNGINNSTMQGAVVGSPGTLPTGWIWTGSNGLSMSVAGTGTENGMSYIDIHFSGTTSTAGPRGFAFTTFVPSTDCPTSSGTPVSFSTYLRAVGGSTTNINNWNLIARGATSGGAATGEYKFSTFTPSFGAVTLNSERKVTSTTFTIATTAYYSPYVEMYPSGAGRAIDITLRVAAPQCEQGGFASSFIPTSGAVVTRSRDALSLPTGAWYNQSAGSFYDDISWVSSTGINYPMFFRVDDTTSNNRWNLYYSQSGNTIGIDGVTLAVNQGGLSTAASTTGSIKAAGAQALNNTNAAFNGVIKTLDTSWSPPTVTQFILTGLGSPMASKWHKMLKYYPLRVSDTQLQLITQ